MSKLILSIDWDFFFEENPTLDWGHHESSVYLDIIWEVRHATALAKGETLEDVIPMRPPDPASFSLEVLKRMNYWMSRRGAVAESHLAIRDLLKRGCEVVNFDAHHDIFYGEFNENAEENCCNWVCGAIMTGKIERYTIVYPEWRRKFPEILNLKKITEAMGQKVRFMYWNEWLASQKGAPRRVDSVFMCRSGAWSPPCYDKQFNHLCHLMFGSRSGLVLPERVLNQAKIAAIADAERQMFADFQREKSSKDFGLPSDMKYGT